MSPAGKWAVTSFVSATHKRSQHKARHRERAPKVVDGSDGGSLQNPTCHHNNKKTKEYQGFRKKGKSPSYRKNLLNFLQ